MNKAIHKATGMCAGLLLAFASGSTAVADDTELLLINPDAAQQEPNILLIIDSSGSMTSPVKTTEIYDSTQTYAGTCNPDYLYWTEYENVIPSCDTSQRIHRDAYRCVAGDRQLQGIGSYRTTMAQFRDGESGIFNALLGLTDAVRWQELEPGNETDIVECGRDAGVHGDGVDGSRLYAQRGGGVAPYTDQFDDRVQWDSWPTSQSVTVFAGNYLNYLVSAPVVENKTRIEVVQDTATAFLNSVEGINVGIMRFNNSIDSTADDQGGTVILDIQDLDSNRDAIMDTISKIEADGFTPVSETLYEAARFWHGLSVQYGGFSGSEQLTDPSALTSPESGIYERPTSLSCAKNFNVLLTDGLPTEDDDAQNYVDGLPDWFTTLGYNGCTARSTNPDDPDDQPEHGKCLDDVAAYLANGDIDPSLPGNQTVTTHTIGFAIDLPLLNETAIRGGGDYFLANDVRSLTLALLEIIDNIQDRSVSFAAPAVAVNTFNRTQNLNDLYLTQFAASETVHWPGNLKKYRISGGQIVDRNDVPAVDPNTGLFYDSAASYWTTTVDGNDVKLGGAAENLPDPTVRNVYTNITVNNDLTAATNAVSTLNESTFKLADFALTGATGEPTIEQVIRWARGEDVADEDQDPTTLVRNSMGDPLHSQPAAIVYGGSPENPDVVVFTATNDGYVHAVDGATGEELWAFIPREHLQNLPRLFFNSEAPYKFYGVDGDIVPVVKDVDNDGVVDPVDGDFVYIIFGMRRGGNFYYALDVTDKSAPKIKWRLSTPDFGQTWSRPTVTRIDMPAASGLNSDKAVVVFGGGYDTAHDTITHPSTPDAKGAGIYFVDLRSGNVLWRAGRDANANLQLPALTRSIATQIRVIDLTGDGFADRMYASDMGGQILRFDIFNGKSPNGTGTDALVTGGVLAQLGAEGISSPSVAETRRFYAAPDVSIFNDNIQNRRFIAISLGSGYRAHPLDDSNTDRFYSIRDRNVFNALSQAEHDAFTPYTDSDLVEVNGEVGTAIGKDQAGWMFELPEDQKVFSNSVTFNNEVFFVAFSADTADAAVCSAGMGRNFLYRVSVVNGDPIANLDAIVPGEEDTARVTELAQGGIAPSPAFLFPSPDPNCTGEQCLPPPPIGCIGVECFEPGFKNYPVRTLWTQDGVE